jgi:uncharacterized repeat protein (TIGR03943 family)
VNRETQGLVLFLVGGAALWASLTDLHLRYVKAGLRPLLIVAGVVLIAAAVVTLWSEFRGSRRGHDDDHGHHGPRIAWLLLLPVFALILVAPPALGSYTASRSGTALQRPAGFTALPADGPLRLSLVDYAARAAYDGGRALGGRSITITGFVTVDRHGAPYLTRMVLNCCAADAQPVKVGLTGQVPPGLRPDTWLDVTGIYTGKQTRDDVNDGIIPYIEVVQAIRVSAPRDQYESM